MLKSLLPNEVKVDITIDDLRQKSILNTNRTISFASRSIFTVFYDLFNHSREY